MKWVQVQEYKLKMSVKVMSEVSPESSKSEVSVHRGSYASWALTFQYVYSPCIPATNYEGTAGAQTISSILR